MNPLTLIHKFCTSDFPSKVSDHLVDHHVNSSDKRIWASKGHKLCQFMTTFVGSATFDMTVFHSLFRNPIIFFISGKLYAVCQFSSRHQLIMSGFGLVRVTSYTIYLENITFVNFYEKNPTVFHLYSWKVMYDYGKRRENKRKSLENIT